MKQARFEVFRGKDGWRWRLRAANSQIVATGEAHTRKRDAVRACQRIADLAGEAANVPLVEVALEYTHDRDMKAWRKGLLELSRHGL